MRHFRVDPRDVQATVAELTAVTISEQVLLSGGCERLMVCGGGSRNPLLMARLAALLPAQKSPPPMPLALVAMTWKHWRSPGLRRTLADYQEICLPSLAQARDGTGGYFPR